MNQEMVKVTIDGKEHEYAIGTTYREIVDEYQEEVAEAPVILVMADGKLRELQKKLKGDCTLEFVTTKDHIGFETYKRTVCLVLLRAIYDVARKYRKSHDPLFRRKWLLFYHGRQSSS